MVFYEWPFYREHLCLIPVFWLGGMATHGLLLGGLIGVLLFCMLHGRSFLSTTDTLAVPAAVLLIVPILWAAARRKPAAGVLTGICRRPASRARLMGPGTR